jgi:RecB family exonuclease
MGAAHPVLQGVADWAAAIAALPATGALPLRTAIVPTERHAHALRRALLRSGRGSVLGGTRFVGAGTLAREILQEVGRDFASGEEALRPARLLGLLEEDLPLEYFALDLLRSTPGWPEAFASAIGDLEAAGLVPERLPASTPQWRDIGLLWRRLDAAAGRSWTWARIHREAAALLEGGARPDTGPVLAAVTGRESAVQARLLRALPAATLAVVAGRPLRERHLDRVGALFGDGARAALAAAPLPDAGNAERDVLARYLFAPPEVLADPDRPRSRGPDGTVSLEEHAGVEAEVEAAAEWVAREVLEHGTPLEEVAVLVPAHDPLAGLVASRIARLPWKGGPFPVHVAGGIPLSATAGGARALALVRSLRSFLPAESVAGVLPTLRAKLDDREHLSAGEATGVAWSLGTVGGSPAHPEGALDWPAHAAAREAQLAAQVAALDPAAERREGWTLRPQLGALRAVLPAIGALSGLARLAVEGRTLSEIAPPLLSFMEAWVLDPGQGTPVHALLRADLDGVRSDAVGASVHGTDALGIVEDRILSLRVPFLRFGEAAVYVGTIGAAGGLAFQAVRILGLSEGALPPAVREDAVLPDRMRAEAGRLVPVSGDRVLAQLHAFDRAVRGAGARIALSVPHEDLDRSERETSSLLVEVGAALGRPDPVEWHVIPDLRSLERTSFGPARAAAAAFRGTRPVTPVQWLDRSVATSEIPPSWRAGPHLDLPRILALRGRTGLGAADGLLGEEGPFPVFPGLAPDRAISASALERLVGCPLRFLLERVLRWEEPAGAVTVRELDALTFGATFHAVAERFYAAHGAGFVARSRDLAHWKKVVREIADDELAALRASYPLVGRGVEEKERARLIRDLETFLAYDWRLPLSRFVAVEAAFDGLALDAGTTRLHVRGYVDRIDVEGDHALVRDLKTGKDHPRDGDEEGPTPTRDIQLGLYGLVARKKAVEWGLPRKLQAAYVYARSGEERGFRSDHAALEKATREWLSIAAGLLAAHAFPPTPSGDDCAFCPFVPVCGDAVRARAAAAVVDAEGSVRAFFDLKVEPEEESG